MLPSGLSRPAGLPARPQSPTLAKCSGQRRGGKQVGQEHAQVDGTIKLDGQPQNRLRKLSRGFGLQVLVISQEGQRHRKAVNQLCVSFFEQRGQPEGKHKGARTGGNDRKAKAPEYAIADTEIEQVANHEPAQIGLFPMQPDRSEQNVDPAGSKMVVTESQCIFKRIKKCRTP